MTVRLLVGDVRDRIREIPDESVDLVATSPPFLALRKYGADDREMGSERTPADFLDALLELTGEFRRVLAPHGSIAIELGDTYSGSGGAGGDYNPGGLREGQEKFEGSGRTARQDTKYAKVDDGRPGGGITNLHGKVQGGGSGWPQSKSLTLIPTLYPASLAYGWNMLNPEYTFDRWRVRNVIVWARPNPPVGALGDKVRPATSYITIACTSAKRWFDLDAVRTEAQIQMGRAVDGNNVKGSDDQSFRFAQRVDSNPAGAPPLDWWEDDDPTGHATLCLPTQPYPGAHYATWPSTLAHRLISMMCPLRVCRECGEPSRRMVQALNGGGLIDHSTDNITGRNQKNPRPEAERIARIETLGWSDCGHDDWRPGRILDPFAGSGTSLACAQGLGRDATGIELYPANADLVRQRVGMFLTVDEGAA